MTLEEMQQTWRTETDRLTELVRLSETRLAWDRIQLLQTPMRRVIFALRFEIAIAAVAMVVLGDFLADHWGQLRFLWPAGLIDLWCLGALISSIHQIRLVARINYAGPIAIVQRQINELRAQRLRTFRWMFLTGQIVWWIPFAIVALKLIFQVDAYRFLTPAFIVINLLAGLVAIPLAIYAASRLKWVNNSSVVDRVADVIAGRSLSEARKQSQALAELTGT